MRYLAALLLTLAAGCGGVTNVVPTGQDTYMIAARGTMGWSSGPAQKAKAYQEASDYCQKQGKVLETVSANDSGAGGFGKISEAEVHFRCVAAGSACSK